MILADEENKAAEADDEKEETAEEQPEAESKPAEKGGTTVAAEGKVGEALEIIKGMTVIELRDLNKLIEEELLNCLTSCGQLEAEKRMSSAMQAIGSMLKH